MSEKSQLIKEVRHFEFFMKWIWPLFRKLAKHHLTARCSRCFLPATYVKLNNGICEFCNEDTTTTSEIDPSRQQLMQEQMDQLLMKTIDSGSSSYDVLLLFSGGKDSSYLLYRLLNDYQAIRILALTVDNTFMSPVAMENVTAIINKVGVDHMILRPKRKTMEKMFGYALTHLNELGCSGTVDQFDGDFFSDLARNIAAEKKIPYVVCGLSRTQVTRILKLNSFITTPEYESQTRKQVAGIKLDHVFDPEEMSYWWDPTKYSSSELPLMVFPFFIWNLEEEFIKAEVIRLNLMPRGDESPLITNNRLIPLMGIVDMIEFGYSSFEPEFAEMVRAGKADRKQWLYSFEMLEYAAKTGRFLSKSLDEILNRLSLTRKELKIKG